MAETWLEVTGVRGRPIHTPVAGASAVGLGTGKNAAPEGGRGVMRWREWLMRRAGPKAA